jgi:hypothetical protein
VPGGDRSACLTPLGYVAMTALQKGGFDEARHVYDACQ